MKISLLVDHPEAIGKIAKWYYHEWAYLSLQITEEMMHQKVMEKAANRDVIPLVIVAHHGNELIGALELKLRENKNYPEYEHWIGGIFVDPLWRGQGVASRMMTMAKEKAKELGVTMLYLQCESHNISLYQKHGFKVLHQANHHTVEATIMRYQQ